MGGFESADHFNRAGVPLHMAQASGHERHLDADYAGLARLGLRSARESIGWRLAEPGADGHFDFTRARRIAGAARRHGVQIVWTLMHYGTPPGVRLTDDAFIPRFVRYAAAAARALRPLSPEPPIYNLINEIGFLAWAVSESTLIHGYDTTGAPPDGSSLRSGYAVKRRLARAVLLGMAAVRREDPRARFLHVEPLVHVVAPTEAPELAPVAAEVRAYQWQVWDLLAGRIEPALGGNAEALDLIGVNYYHNGQWEVGTERRLLWHLRDPRRMPFSRLLQEAAQRYDRPLLIAETSHVGRGRGAWLEEVTDEVLAARDRGVDVQGLCLYPVVDRPDWNDAAHWHHSGLWNVDASSAGALERRLDLDYAKALRRCQRRLGESRAAAPASPSHRPVSGSTPPTGFVPC